MVAGYDGKQVSSQCLSVSDRAFVSRVLLVVGISCCGGERGETATATETETKSFNQIKKTRGKRLKIGIEGEKLNRCGNRVLFPNMFAL